MLSEIHILSYSGLPILEFYADENKEQLEINILEAGFLTAMINFAEEIDTGELKLIETERRVYLLKKNRNFSTIFTFDENKEDFSTEKDTLEELNAFVVERIGDKIYSPNEMIKPENLEKAQQIRSYISEQEILKAPRSQLIEKSVEAAKQLERLIYRSVGYVPGQCNIGIEERLKRLTAGFLILIGSFIALVVMMAYDMPVTYRWFLLIPNIGAFVSILQFWHQFCITNAARRIYTMR